MQPQSTRAVLIVDDDPCIRTAVSRTLKREGIESLEASNLRQALRHVVRRRSCIGLAICDLSLGGDNGMDLVRHLHRRHPEIPTVVLTAFGDWDAYAEALGEQVCGFLSKPVASGELVGVVRAALGMSETGPALRRASQR